MSILRRLRRIGQAGGADPVTATLWTTPWRWRTTDGIWVGFDGSVWLYRTLPTTPLEWEDRSRRFLLGKNLEDLLRDLGATSRPKVGPLGSGARYRQIHLLTTVTEEFPPIPAELPGRLREYLSETLDFTVPVKHLFIGVLLWPRLLGSAAQGGVWSRIRDMLVSGLGEGVPDLSLYAEDAEVVHRTLRRYGGRVPDRRAIRALESWYNLGRGTDVPITEYRDHLEVADVGDLELAAVMEFPMRTFAMPDEQWIAELEAHRDAPAAVSLRAVLEPPSDTRNRARRIQRILRAHIAEEEATGDLERSENTRLEELAKAVEDHFAQAHEPMLSSASIVVARWRRPVDETWLDYLRSRFDIYAKPLEYRQMAALEETLPASGRRVNPFLQDLTVPMVAYAGFHGWSSLGDPRGLYVGLVVPHMTPCWVDPGAASRRNVPPVTGVFGDPGSGKTFLAQLIAVQATWAGIPTVMINPKGFDSLAATVDLAGGRVVSMSALQREPGAFDPFGFAPTPEMAAEIAASHILSVLGSQGVAGYGFTQAQELELQAGLKRGAANGARCVGEALQAVADPEVVRQVTDQLTGSSLFALGVSPTPVDRRRFAGGLTLIEFDRPLDIPDPTKASSAYTRGERISMAALRLVTRASLELLHAGGGGVLVVDEAHTYLTHPETRATLERLGREGRSLNVMFVAVTQRVADLVDRDLEGFISRVFALKLSDTREAAAALRICGLEPSEERVRWMATIGPSRDPETGEQQPATALHRDLDGRHAPVVVWPVPDWVVEAISTNPEDRARRRAGSDTGAGGDPDRGVGPDAVPAGSTAVTPGFFGDPGREEPPGPGGPGGVVL